MTVAAPALDDLFARELPELAVPWQAAPAPAPRLLVLDDVLAADLGLDPDWLRTPDGLRLLTGERPPAGARPVAQVYAGHQFGGFTPRLGDGRALLLGEVVGRDGARRDLHLKGSGRTPLSRGGDGLAAVGPMLREHVVSTAMHALGIPTTRSLAVVATGRPVQRETVLPGAVLARVGSSHLRVGTVEFARATGDVDLLRRVVDHAVSRHCPAAADADRPALALFAHVVQAQARLVAQWMLVGFVHGVMNTDNVLLSGETVDYGPCAFLDGYDAAAVFSSIDEGGRYAYGNQPLLAEWDLAQLAEALLPLLGETDEQAVETATEALGAFRPAYNAAWQDGVRRKLGLPAHDGPLTDDLLALLQADRVDWTAFFRALGRAARGDTGPARSLVLDLAGVDAWLARWQALSPDADLCDRSNPAYVPRNALVEEALAAATAGDLAPVERLVDVLRDPFTERPGLERYAAAPLEQDPSYRTFCGT